MRTFRLNNMRAYARPPIFLVLLAVAGTAVPSRTYAQNSSASASPFVSGPLVWSPSFQLREAGVDSNVFNSSTDPKQDVGGNALSQVNSVLSLGILQATTLGSLEYMYFDRFKNERGFNRRVNSHLEFPVTRFSPDVTVSWAKAKERSGNEIDTRAPRTDWGYAVGLQTRVTTRMAVSVTAGKQKSTYERGFAFREIEIARQLDRESLVASVSTRITLTPLSTMVVDASVNRDDFPFRPDAATDNLRVNAGFDFAPDAVIRGRTVIGYHSLQPHHPGVSNAAVTSFDGFTSSTELAYTLLGVTRVSGRFSRDSNYSISTTQPLYLSTGGGLDILQTLFGPVDANVHAARERLKYPRTDLAPEHTDVADTVGGGLSIRVATGTVVALLYDNTQRRSTAGREFGYERRRIYTTVTYGF